MSDVELQRLERTYRTSRAEADGVAWLRAAMRAGRVREDAVALAVACPDDVAGRRIARATGTPAHELSVTPMGWLPFDQRLALASGDRDERWLEAVIGSGTPLDEAALRRFARDSAARTLSLLTGPLRATCERALRGDPAATTAARAALEEAMGDLSVNQRHLNPLAAIEAALTEPEPASLEAELEDGDPLAMLMARMGANVHGLTDTAARGAAASIADARGTAAAGQDGERLVWAVAPFSVTDDHDQPLDERVVETIALAKDTCPAPADVGGARLQGGTFELRPCINTGLLRGVLTYRCARSLDFPQEQALRAWLEAQLLDGFGEDLPVTLPDGQVANAFAVGKVKILQVPAAWARAAVEAERAEARWQGERLCAELLGLPPTG